MLFMELALLQSDELGPSDAAQINEEDHADDRAFNRPPQLHVPRTIVLHYSPLKAAWDWLILLLVLYIAVFTPYVAAFHFNYDSATTKQPKRTDHIADLSDPLILVDLIVDIMFMADMLVNFRTTYLCNGEVVLEPKKIAVNYLKTWFIIDAVSAIPFDLILERTGTSDVSVLIL